MEKTLLKNILLAAARPVAGVNFGDAQSAAKNALVEHFGLEGISIRDMKKHGPAIFAIIEEVVEQILPVELESRVGQFAEIKTFGRDETPKFTIKGVGQTRVLRSIVKGARGGIYRAKKLDDRELMVTTNVYTVGYQVTLEELLTGRRTVAELVDLIAKGFVEIMYAEVIKMLRTIAVGTNAPAANKNSGTGIDTAKLNALIRTVSAYGNPVIIGFQSEVELLTNAQATMGGVTLNPNVAAADLEEIRNAGRVSTYRGTPIIVLPNYFMDETNAQWMFNESQLFILPVNERPVKVALHGELYTAEVMQPHGGVEYHAHQMMGFAILFYNAIAIYEDTNNANDDGAY